MKEKIQKKEIINKFIALSIKHENSLRNNPENYKDNNKIAQEINKLGNIIENNPNFLEDYIYILKKKSDLAGIIGIRLKDYEIELSKKLYESWYNSNPEKNWIGKFILSDWNKIYDKNIIKKVIKLRIDNYNKWKNENKEEYNNNIKEINKIIDNLKKHRTPN